MSEQEDLQGKTSLFQTALIMFTVMSLATTEFIKNVFPFWDALRPDKTMVIYTIFIVQVIPAAILIGADRYIVSRYGAGRVLRNFRRMVFLFGFVLILRQVQLYWGPATDLADEVRSASVALLALLDLVVVAAMAFVVWRGYRGVVQFFYYMSPIAIAASAIIAFQVRTDEEDLPLYAQEVTTVEEGDERSPVFIFVFDGLGYDTMHPDGELDREAFRNAARLADSGVSLSNAISNFFWSIESLPTVVEPATSLTGEYNVRLYTQFPALEETYYSECGVTITCRGIRHVTESAPLQVASNLALRAFYEAIPEAAETVIRAPMGPILDGLEWPYPSADPTGWQIFTKRQFDSFVDDVNAESARGSLYVVHVLVPHWPYAYDEDGHALATAGGYRPQARFGDKLLGKFIDKIEREGLFDESTIIVTADHGPRPVTPSATEVPEVTTPRVPLIIHAPTLEEHGVVMDVEYQHIDFAATLADVLELDRPAEGAGVSAFDPERPDRERTFDVRGIGFVYNEQIGVWEHAD